MKLVTEQKQMLSMVMTTELRQAIELLQLSTYELLQFVQKKAEENPFIELVEKEEVTSDFKPRLQKQFIDGDLDPIVNTARKEKNMYEVLMEQLLDKPLNEREKRIVEYFILNINENGFASIENEEVCEHLQVDITEVIAARKIVLTLEPRGVGARDLTEALLVQAQDLYLEDDIVFTIIKEHLQSLADKKWSLIAKSLGCSLQEIQTAFEKIQKLHPRPAMELVTSKVDYIQPDITINYDEEKRVHTIQLHEHYIPHLRFNHAYSERMKGTSELTKYVQHQFKQFEWLQNSIQQRRSTILKIMNVIVHQQHTFLQQGFRYLKPLTLKEVADEIEMHESTVSRATANKIVQTPTGIFELRRLFSTKITSHNGDKSSQTEVKEIIKELVKKEDKYKPLSDQKIANYIKTTYDIVISRRTVAKYRDELFILSSSKRKEIKI